MPLWRAALIANGPEKTMTKQTILAGKEKSRSAALHRTEMVRVVIVVGEIARGKNKSHCLRRLR